MTPFEEGLQDRKKGVLEPDNPYTPGTNAYAEYVEGYLSYTFPQFDPDTGDHDVRF